MDFHDFPIVLGKSGCRSQPPPKLCAGGGSRPNSMYHLCNSVCGSWTVFATPQLLPEPSTDGAHPLPPVQARRHAEGPRRVAGSRPPAAATHALRVPFRTCSHEHAIIFHGFSIRMHDVFMKFYDFTMILHETKFNLGHFGRRKGQCGMFGGAEAAFQLLAAASLRGWLGFRLFRASRYLFAEVRFLLTF